MKNRERTKKLILSALFTALIIVGAYIKIPAPPVPFTLQGMFVMLAGLLLGKKWGTISVLTYILLGLIGIPVFTSGGGISYVLNPNFGYIVGFAVMAFLIGLITEKGRNTYPRLFAAAALGIVAMYLCGMAHYYLINTFYVGNSVGLWPMFVSCCLIFLPKEVVLCIICVPLTRRLRPIIDKM